MNQQNNQPVRRSRRLATIIPASHWVSIGYSEDDAQRMELLQNDMKRYCDGDDAKIDLRRRSGAILPHHDMMLPLWQKLFKSLSTRATFEDFRIAAISMPESVLDIMLPSLQSTNNLTKMSIRNANLGNEGLLRLADFIKENSSLEQLVLGYETINDLSVAASFSDALKNHATLKNLMLNKCGLNNISILEEILEGCRGMEGLGIVKDGFGSEGVALIADFIRSNESIETLLLTNNGISDNDTLVLASALMQCSTNLIRLDLQNNNITEEGEKVLLKALYDPTSMDAIAESNHTCKPYTYDTSKSSIVAKRSQTEVLRINGKITSMTNQQKIRKKVVLALCGVDGELFDLSHFNDLPLQLMPRVLELIQEHSSSRKKRSTVRPTS